jgi:hypothetical protein
MVLSGAYLLEQVRRLDAMNTGQAALMWHSTVGMASM